MNQILFVSYKQDKDFFFAREQGAETQKWKVDNVHIGCGLECNLQNPLWERLHSLFGSSDNDNDKPSCALSKVLVAVYQYKSCLCYM